MWPRSWRARAIAAAVGLAAGTVLAWWGGSGIGVAHGGSAPSQSSVLTVAASGFGAFADDFNVYSPDCQGVAFGMIYEPLFFFDKAKAGVVSPWLGTSYAWSRGGKTLTVRLRSGVQWTDGTPFTSADVVFTFDLALHGAAFNQFLLPLASVRADGPYGVTIDFSRPAYADAYDALGRVEIMPEHIWAAVRDPATFRNVDPVGTGAYELSGFSSQAVTLTANSHYYLPGLPKFETVRFLANHPNGTDAAIESGAVDWGSQYIAGIGKLYLARNTRFAVSDIPLFMAFLVPNLASGPTASLAVRQAISVAINRADITDSVYGGYALPANPEALILPNYSQVLDPALAHASFGGPSAATARRILARARIKTPLTLTVDVIGYPDLLSDLKIIQSQLRPAGIILTISAQPVSGFNLLQDTGKFQLLWDSFGNTPDPYSYYHELLDSSIAPPVGHFDTLGNFGRYRNAEVDALLNAIASTPAGSAQQPDFDRIEQIFAGQLPDIPLFSQQDEVEFNGSAVTGYPTSSDPYASPDVYERPDLGWIAARLAPVKPPRRGPRRG